jgi:DNA end-binding protein Ku
MIEAKVKHLPMPKEEAAPRSTKVVNLMDALRKSVQGAENPDPKPSKKSATDDSRPTSPRAKVAVINSPKKSAAKSTKPAKKRRSA